MPPPYAGASAWVAPAATCLRARTRACDEKGVSPPHPRCHESRSFGSHRPGGHPLANDSIADSLPMGLAVAAG